MRMRKAMRILATACLAAAAAVPTARAGAYSDEMSKCLVGAITDKDKTDLAKWIFATAALHPDVKEISSVTPEGRADMTQAVAQLFERLLTESCKDQYRDAAKNDGPAALSAGFQALTQVAMQALMQNPEVTKGFGELDQHLNKQKLASVTQQTEAPGP